VRSDTDCSHGMFYNKTDHINNKIKDYSTLPFKRVLGQYFF